MIKILQYGEGNFLRTFVDAYFDTLNKEGLGEYRVSIVKPIPFGSLQTFERQNNRYHIVLRGRKEGKTVEDSYPVDVVEQAIDPFVDRDAYEALAQDPALRLIVSNTTEAGICFCEQDTIDGFAEITFPAKLTKFLYARYQAGLEGVYLLPVELIDHNATTLAECVQRYISLWGLPQAFAEWNREQNCYCNTLVDRIVSGHPKDAQSRDRLFASVGCEDALLSVGEPFGFWAVENKGEIAKYLPTGMHNIEVVLTHDIDYYKKRKVRVLNGSHTNLVWAGLFYEKQTVYDCMQDESLSRFLEQTLSQEIVPFVSYDIVTTTAFADSVKERFQNPFLNHQLTSIALNSISKWKARNLCSFGDYYRAHGKIAPCMTIGFSYLMAAYTQLKKRGNDYIVTIAGREIPVLDDVKYLDYFANGGDLIAFLQNTDVWGEDLCAYAGFGQAVVRNVQRIVAGEALL